MTKEMINKMIFDLQLFADPEIYLATSSNETVSITKGDSIEATAQKEGRDPVALTPKIKGAGINGVNAGAGTDSIYVGAGVKDMSIIGGRGNDVVSIDSAEGNKYVYNYGDGKDSIYGWKKDKDVLVLTNSSYTTAMSADGNELLIKQGAGWISFSDLQYNDKITVSTASGEDEVVFQKLMQGTTRSESINNTVESGTVHKGAATVTGGAITAIDPWAIKADAGNDSITNNFEFVSIHAGDGNDKIFILFHKFFIFIIPFFIFF